MKKYSILFLAAGMMTLASCDSYLDKLPDDRAEVNTLEKAKQFLVSAYPSHSPNFIFRMSSDNVTDNGVLYVAQPNQTQAYTWQPIETEGNDDPKSIWNANYEAAAVANMTLESLAGNESEDANAVRAEALLCRAYAMFQNANTFCMAWNEEKADEYLGIPYPKVSGESVDERGTLRQTYENINADIEAALPMLNDGYLTVPKYHFNQKAAYAFAARFNLFYHNWDKAIEYATRALGTNPSTVLRNMSGYATLAGVDDIHNKWIRSSENCNFMFIQAVSTAGRAARGSSSYKRIAHNRDIITSQTFWSASPWCSGGISAAVSSSDATKGNALYEARNQYGTNQCVYIPSLIEDFEITDKINNTGYAHVVDPVFTGDETILVRAEAYIMKKQYDEALADMNAWLAAHGEASSPWYVPLTVDYVNTILNGIRMSEVPSRAVTEETIKKPLNPQGFSIEEGTQTNMIYTVLHMRRITTMYQGQRWLDIKRWGIEFTHHIDGEDNITFKAGDLRGAIQLPSDVIDAGLEANPREGAEN